MKCPKCSHNQLRGKQGMICKSCRYTFILDPKTHQLTDGKFLAFVRKASREGTYYFTEEELYHIAALKAQKNWGCLFGGIVIMIFGSSFFHGFLFEIVELADPIPVVLTVLLVALVIFGVIRGIPAKLPRKKWNKLVNRWKKKSAEPIPGLIEEATLQQPPPQELEADIYQYGAARLIICQHDIQVDWLVLNNFHSANGAVVLSENGYPGYIAIRADELLQSNPNLEVVLVHDAGHKGEAMKQRILDGWPIKEEQIQDVGITTEMLPIFGVNKRVVKEFGSTFPLHALPYHHMQTLLSRSLHELNNGGDGSFVFVWETTYGEDGDLDGDGDFG